MIEADKKETIIVGYAFLEDESEEERAALQRRLEKTFGTDHLLYLAGDKEDVENAKKAGKSLGIYLAEQILAGEDFHKVVNEATEEEVLELLEKKWIVPLVESIYKLPDTVIDSLVSKIQALQSKYATTFFEVEQQISETEATLAGMIDELEGKEYDMLGLSELKKLLGGSAE